MTMTNRLDLLKMIYVPRALGADTMLKENSEPEFDALDPEFTLGVRYVADKYFPILAEDTAAKLTPVSADIMREVVADKLWCPWRLERDGFKLWDDVALRNNIRVFGDGCVPRLQFAFVQVDLKGIHTYSDLITLVRLAEG